MSKNHIRLPIGEGEYIENKDSKFNTNSPQLVVQTKFLNLSKEVVVVCFRDGTYSLLPPIESHIVVDKIYIGYEKTGTSVKIEVIPGHECNLNQRIQQQLFLNNNMFLYYEEAIHTSHLHNNRSGCYIKNADIVLILYTYLNEMTHHPFCTQYVHNLYLNSLDRFDGSKDIGITIRLICNEGKSPKVYTILHNKIFTLESHPSNTLKSGFYITGLSELSTNYLNGIRRDEYYTFDSILGGTGPVKIYTTLLAAKTALSDVFDNSKLIQLKLDHEKSIAELQREQQILKEKNLILSVEREKETQRLKEEERAKVEYINRQRAQIENDILAKRDLVEAKKTDSKIFVEGLKIAAALFGVGFAFLKIFK